MIKRPALLVSLGLLALVGVAAAYYFFPRTSTEATLTDAADQVPPGTPGQRAYQHGLILERQGRLSEAVSHLQIAIEQNPNQAQFYNGLGRLYLNQADWAGAKRALEKGLSLDGSNLRIHFHLGRVHYELNQAQEAEKHFAEAIKLDPHFADAHDWLGLTYLLQAAAPVGSGLPLDRPRVEEALKEMVQAIELDPENALYHLHAARASEVTKDFDRMAAHLEKAIALDAKLAEAHQRLGDLYAMRGDLENAEQGYRRALALNPGQAEAHHALGQVLINLGRYADAEQSLEAAVRLEPGNAQFHYSLGTALLRLGEQRPGQEEMARYQALRERHKELNDFEKAAIAQPNDVQLCLALAVAYKQAGRLNDAMLQYRRAIALDERCDKAYLGLGVIYLEHGKLPEAEQHFRKALPLDPADVQAKNNLGLVYLKQGNAAEAVKILEAAAVANPTQPYVFSNLGLAYLEKGDLPGAFRNLRRALQLDPGSVDAQLNRGRAELEAGNFSQAVKGLERVIQRRPEDPAAHYWLAQAYEKAGRSRESQAEMRRYQQLSEQLRRERGKYSLGQTNAGK